MAISIVLAGDPSPLASLLVGFIRRRCALLAPCHRGGSTAITDRHDHSQPLRSPGMTSFRGVVVVAALAVSIGEARAEVTAADLDWPASTRSVRTKVATKVYQRPKKRGGRAGKIAKGQRVAWTKIVKTSDRCRAWIEVEPRGWVCAKDVAPSDEEPAATEVPRKVKPGADPLGLDLVVTPPPSWPFAWALEPQKWRRRDQGKKRRPPRPTKVRAAARADADVVRTLEPRAVVAVLETRGKFVRIGEDEWVAARDLRVVAEQARPDGVGADERWIDVDLEEQVLVAYQGDTPVWATLISSGRRNGTPTGIYRVHSKAATITMRDSLDATSRWRRDDVPFALRFRERYALHGAYWHDRFGNQESVGCVNLTPDDARWIYEWADPAVPEGWLEVRAGADEGTVVRIRSADDPDPAWLDYDGEPR
jgi:lipoprotein-anchoring transpeptidase ErfK/SrfK